MTTPLLSVADVEPAVSVLDRSRVLILALSIADRDLASFVSREKDPAAAVTACATTGARALLAVHGAAEVRTVEDAVERLAASLEGRVADGVAAIERSTHELTSPGDGALAQSVDALTERLDAVLTERFNPDDRRSVLGELQRVIAEVHRQQLSEVRAMLASSGDAPLGRLRTDLLADLNNLRGSVHQALTDLAARTGEASGAARARADRP